MRWTSALTLLVVCVSPVYAQQKDPGQDSWSRPVEFHEKNVSLAAAISILSQKLGLNMLADDKPMLATADFDLSGDLKSVLDAITDKYDYVWTRSEQGVILLRKRFLDPKERPQVFVPEVKQTAKDITSILSTFGAQRTNGFGEILHTLYASLNKDQFQLLSNGGVLYANQLQPAQQTLVQQAIGNVAFGTLSDNWDTLRQQLTSLDRGTIEIVDAENNLQSAPTKAPKALWQRLFFIWQDISGKHRRPLLRPKRAFEK